MSLFSNMWHTILLRFIRRRLVLFIIFASSLTYCIVSFLRDGHHKNMAYQDIPVESKPFIWRTLQEYNETSYLTCRNSVQGKSFIADDRGYVCRRKNMDKNGCCHVENEKIKRYSCHSCIDNNCCIIYEYCVSCCQNPKKRHILKEVLLKLSAEESVLFHSIRDDYELCLTKCRTSSHSVFHENSYKDPKHKHCFGYVPKSKPD